MPPKAKKSVKKKASKRTSSSRTSAKKKKAKALGTKKKVSKKAKPKKKAKIKTKKAVSTGKSKSKRKRKVPVKKGVKEAQGKPLERVQKEVRQGERELGARELFTELRDMQRKRPRQESSGPTERLPLMLQSLPEPFKYALVFVIGSAMVMIMVLAVVTLAMAFAPDDEGALPAENDDDDFSTIVAAAVEQNESIVETTMTTATTQTTSSTTTTVESIICNEPYMRFGLGCCLDKNGNGICDADEAPKTTTTTLPDYVRCKNDNECGDPRTDLICDGNIARKKIISHRCREAGTRASTCETNVVDEIVDTCDATERCYVRGDNIECRRTSTSSNLFQR